MRSIFIVLGVFPSSVYVHAHEDRNGGPDHEDEEEERVADVTSQVGNESDDQRTNERAGLEATVSNVRKGKEKILAPCP